MAATIKLKGGITDPPNNILQQRELGVNTSTDELFIGTQSGRAKQIASVPYIQKLLNGYVNAISNMELKSEYVINVQGLFCGLLILQQSGNTFPVFLSVNEGVLQYKPITESTHFNYSINGLILQISSTTNFNVTLINFTGYCTIE